LPLIPAASPSSSSTPPTGLKIEMLVATTQCHAIANSGNADVGKVKKHVPVTSAGLTIVANVAIATGPAVFSNKSY